MSTKRVLGVVVSLVLLAGCTVHDGRGRGRPYGGGYGGPIYGGPAYGMAGCGLGAVLFGPNNSPGAQILASTTNGTTGTQTLGITSGTSNCSWGGLVRAEREQAAFAEVNFQDLKHDMASGGGEFLVSFSTLLGCEESARPVLFTRLQSGYRRMVPSEDTSPEELLIHIKGLIQDDAVLGSACTDTRAVARAEGRTLASANDTSAAPSAKR